MLNLICGASGVGKTDALVTSIHRDVENKTKCYLIVPEQQAYISERELYERLPQNAGLYFEVVSFSGLAEDVFRAFGGVTKISADPALSALLMWNTLRTHTGFEGGTLANRRIDGPTTALMLQTVADLRANGITPDALMEASESEKIDRRLRDKLSYVAMIEEAYHATLESAFGTDPADKLERLAALLDEHDFFRGCNAYVDSFTSFTAPEYKILSALLKQAESVTVTLCADSPSSKLPHFEGVMQTKKYLCAMADRAGCSVHVETLSVPTASKPLELRVLSDRIWDFSVRRESRTDFSEKDRETTRILYAKNLYEEAEAAALYICELVQSGMSYRDIAVVMRDAEVYRGVLDAALERYGIPYFFSERTDLSSKPIARMILCALRVVVHNFRREDVISLLKTGLCGTTPKQTAMFEEYCETWHISGKHFTNVTEDWSMNPDGLTTNRSERASEILKTANDVRRMLIPPLKHLAAEIKVAHTFTDLCRALYNYLEKSAAPDRLLSLAKKELANRRPRQAMETVRLYKQITELLASACRLLPNAQMEPEEFITAITLLLSNTDLGSVPTVQDCVIVGSASMLRVENIRASLLLGLCEGEFPAAVTDTGMFTDSEKITLEGLRISNGRSLAFSSNAKLRNSEELFYVYRAIAKPTEKLFLSTVISQTDGSARTPSTAFNRALFLLGRDDFKKIKKEIFESSDVSSARAAFAASAAPLLHGVEKTDAATLCLSSNSISDFVKCPYLYYLKHELSLRDPKDATPKYSDDGDFLHYVFERFLRGTLTDGGFVIPDEEEVEPLADAIIEDYIRDFFQGSAEWLGDRMLHHLSRLRLLALLMLRDILAELDASGFIPSEFEKPIGRNKENALPPVTLQLKNDSTVQLTGKIDRVDVYVSEGKRFVRIVDYKTSEHLFSLENLEKGSDVQLVLYLYAYFCSDTEASPYGANFVYFETEGGAQTINRSGFYLSDASVEHAPDAADSVYTKPLAAQSASDISALFAIMSETVKGIAERILDGEARKTPSAQSCKYCPIKQNCAQACHNKKD